MEQWKPIGGGYEVSTLGRVRSKRGRIMAQQTQRGLARVLPLIDGQRVCRYVHKLVATAFHGPMPQGWTPRHRDGDKLNNTAGNLVWRQQALKLTGGDVRAIRIRLAAGEKHLTIAPDFGVTEGSISHINTGHTWAHTRS